jgi:hypothetical protein
LKKFDEFRKFSIESLGFESSQKLLESEKFSEAFLNFKSFQKLFKVEKALSCIKNLLQSTKKTTFVGELLE